MPATPPGHKTIPGAETAIALFEAMENGVLVVNSNMGIEYVNSVFVKELGPANGAKCHRYLTGSKKICPWCKKDLVFGKNVSARSECYLEKTKKHYEVVDSPFKDGGGRALKLSVFNDITKRKKAEDALRSRASQLALVAELEEKALVGVSLDQLLQEAANRTAAVFDVEECRISRILPGGGSAPVCSGSGLEEELIENSTENAPSPKTADIDMRAWLDAVIPGRERSFGVIGLFSRFRHEFTEGDANFLQTVANILGDAVEREKAEALLRLQGKITENAGEGILLLKCTDNTILYVNPRFEKMFGYAPGELLGKPGSIISRSPDTFHENTALIMEVIEKEGKWSGELVDVRKDGTTFWNAVNISAFDHAEHGRALISHHTDITERKMAELESAAQRMQLMQADRLKSLGVMVAGVAHEINNPNNYILLNSEFLAGIFKDARPLLDDCYRRHGDFVLHGVPCSKINETIQKLLAGITEGSGRIKLYIDKLKEFSSQRPAKDKEAVDMNRVVKSAVALLGPQIGASTTRFSLECAGDLPKVNGRFYELEQVVINLLVNACQSLPGRDSSLKVATAPAEDGRKAMITVWDEGVGISPENMKKIFEPLFTTKQGKGGSGLGLAVSRSIVKDHGGALEFQSGPGKGTTATVSLPALGG